MSFQYGRLHTYPSHTSHILMSYLLLQRSNIAYISVKYLEVSCFWWWNWKTNPRDIKTFSNPSSCNFSKSLPPFHPFLPPVLLTQLALLICLFSPPNQSVSTSVRPTQRVNDLTSQSCQNPLHPLAKQMPTLTRHRGFIQFHRVTSPPNVTLTASDSYVS